MKNLIRRILKESLIAENTKHSYMMLSRLQQDLKYYYGHGGESERNLYYKDLKKHIEEVTKLWNSLDEKPEWFTKEELKHYQSKV